MKITLTIVASLLSAFMAIAADEAAPAEKTFDAPHGMKVAVKMIGPYSQPTDLQIICVFKHKAEGDTYLSAMKDLNDKLGGLLSSLRDRGEFTGELGETILLDPPAGSIVPSRLLVIGLGPESQLSLETLKTVGRVALREAVAAKAKNVSFAPVLRDQGNSVLDVGEGDRAVVENVILAYDTEKRLQDQKLAEPFDIANWTIEAGPTFFDGAVKQIKSGIDTATQQTSQRSNEPYSSVK
jgi:Cytosol aminopeptidase family, N-terminal domain